MNDRLLYLTLTDSALEAAWLSYCLDLEAMQLYDSAVHLDALIIKADKNGSRAYAETMRIKQAGVLERHSLALHMASKAKGQYGAFQTMRKYIARQGYKVQSF